MTAYLFDEFALDTDRGSLTRSGKEIILRPKSFDVLRHLLRNAGKLVSKDDLLNAVWPDVHVSDDSLSQCVMEVRKALDDENHLLLKTVPRRGYVLIGDVVIREGGEPAPERSMPRRRTWVRPTALLLGGSIAGAILTVTLPQLVGELQAALFQRKAVIERLLWKSETAIGQALGTYPSGTPAIVVDIVPLPPGAESGWHTHPVPVLGYVLEGQFTTDYGIHGVRSYKAGDVVLEAVDWPHNVKNHGVTMTRILVITLGTQGQESRQDSTPGEEKPNGSIEAAELR